MKASGQIASYLSVLAVSPRWRYGRRAGQILPFWRQRRPCFRGRPVAHDSSSHVALPFRMFVVHVVAGLAVIPVARVATGVHVLGPAQGALARVRGRCLVRGFLRLRSGRKFDDLVVRVTTVSGERRWRHFRWGRWSALLLLIHLLLLLRLYEIYILESSGWNSKSKKKREKDLRTSTQWGMDLAMRNRVDGFEMAIGRHFSAPGFCEGRNVIIILFDFDQRRKRRKRETIKSSLLFIATGTFLRESRWQAGSVVKLAAKRYDGVFVSSHLGLGVWLARPDERIFLRVDHRGKRDVDATPVDTTPERAEIESISTRGGGKKSCSASRNKIEPNVAYISSSGWHGYEENINIALRSFLQIHSIRLVESRFRFFFPIFFSLRRGGVLRLFINEKKEEGRKKLINFGGNDSLGRFLLAEEERCESSSHRGGTWVPHAWIRSSN